MGVLKHYAQRVQSIVLDKNLGFAGGYNAGLKEINSDIYVLLNSDIEVTQGWLEPLIDSLGKATVAVCGPKIRSVNDRSKFEYAGGSGGYLDRHGYAFCRGRIFDVIEQDEGQYDDEIALAWISGCAMAIRAELFHQIGGFDDQFFAHYEEIDLCWRLRRSGYRILCVPESMVYHLGGGTMNYASPRKLFLNFRNSLFMLYKNLDGWLRFNKILTRLILDGLAGLVFLFEGKFKYIGSILSAHVDFYKNIARLQDQKKLEKRLIDKMKIGITRKDGHSSKSIIWNFFIRRRQTFNTLHRDEMA